MTAKYRAILTTIALTIGLNLLEKSAQAQESTFNDVFQKGLFYAMNATPLPPVDGPPDDRTGAGTRAIELFIVKSED